MRTYVTRWRWSASFLLRALLLLLIGLCSCGTITTGTSTHHAGPIKIGISLPLSGKFQADGVPTRQGYELWRDEVNKSGGLLGHQVQLDILDDNSSTAQTGVNYRTLIGVHHDDLVLGPFADDYTVAAARAAALYSYAMINGSGVAPAVFTQGLTNLFSVSLPAKDTLASLAAYVLHLPAASKPTTAVYATENDPYLQPIVEEAKGQLERGGVQTSIPEIVYPSSSDTDVIPIAAKLIQAHADVVVLGTMTPDAITFVKQFKQQHYNPKILVEVSGPDQGSQFTNAIGGPQVAEGIMVPNGGWFPSIQTYGNAQFVANYIAKYGGTADDISSDSVQAFAVGQVLQQAIVGAQSLENGALMQQLRHGTFQSLQGPVKFDAAGQNILATALLFQWRSSHLVPTYPEPYAQAPMEYPKPPWS